MITVWIVDDDEEMIRAVQLMLKMLGCEVRYFLSARQAGEALLKGECPDLFILDINMPEVSGIDFLEFLRQRVDFKNIPAVMLSTEASDIMVDKAINLGADAYITKPVSIGELETAIKRALRVDDVDLMGHRMNE
jgi:CheY-like chemotaxis protein